MNQIDIPVFKARLLDELRSELDTPSEASSSVVQLDKRRTPGRRPSTLLKVAAGAVVLAGVGVFALTRSTSTPAYAMTESADGIITVTWQDGFKDGDALEASLRDAGVDVTVKLVNTSPSLVGSTIGVYPSDPDELTTGFTYGDNGMVIDTSQLIGSHTIDIAVSSDGPYDVIGSAFDYGEVLDGLTCAVLNPMQVSDIAPLVADQNLDVVWNLNRVVDAPIVGTPSPDEAGDYRPFGLQSEVVETAPPGLVLSARSREPGSVTIDVLADGESPDEALAFFESPSDPCTPERAARWNR